MRHLSILGEDLQYIIEGFMILLLLCILHKTAKLVDIIVSKVTEGKQTCFASRFF